MGYSDDRGGNDSREACFGEEPLPLRGSLPYFRGPKSVRNSV